MAIAQPPYIGAVVLSPAVAEIYLFGWPYLQF